VDVHVKNATKIGDKTCLIQLENTTDKIAIMKNKRNLKDEKIYINEDWSRWEREIQTTIRTIAKEEEMKGSSRRADDEPGEGILGNQKFKKMHYLNVSESGIGSRKGRLRLFYYCAAPETCKKPIPKNIL
jgi:hypothetical protein